MKRTIHLTGLNGLRAIAALAVVFSHTTMGFNEFGLDKYIFGKNPDGLPRSTLLAGLGVSIFFALSGFLITYLLLEENRSAPINIRNFYMRRILRIWPLYYLYITASIITLLIFKVPFDMQPILFCIFLMANVPFIAGTFMPLLGHYWSIGVEEQFYAFWPWVVKRSKNLFRFVIISASVLIVIKVILHVLEMKYHWELPFTVIHVTRFHCMLIGAAGGILYFENHPLFLKLSQHWTTQLISWTIIFLAAINYFHIISVLDNEIISFVTILLIMGQVSAAKKFINLENPVCHFLGKISYGIYIFHPIVIFYLQRSIHFSTANWQEYLLIYASVFTFTILLAFISYEFYEKRFLKMKLNYSTIVSN